MYNSTQKIQENEEYTEQNGKNKHIKKIKNKQDKYATNTKLVNLK